MNKSRIHKISIYRKKVKVKPSTDSRLASKHFDIVIGFDFHIIKVGTIPVPCPVTPFLGMVFEVMDYIHIEIPAFPLFYKDENGKLDFNFKPMPMGGTVMINGFHKTIATSGLMALPPLVPPIPGKLKSVTKKLSFLHAVIPKPLFLIPPLAPHDGQISHGSKTVITESREQSAMMNNAYSCVDMGRVILTYPTGFFNNYATFVAIILPFGKPVMVGGPFEEHSPKLEEVLNAWLMMGVMKGGGKLLKKALGKMLTKINTAIHNSSKNPKVRNACQAVQPAICKYLGEPVDAASGHLTGKIQGFELAAPLPFVWEATYYSDSEYSGAMGKGIYHSYSHTLSVNEKEKFVSLCDENGIIIPFPIIEPEKSFYNPVHKWTLYRNPQGEYYAGNRQGLYFYFTENTDSEEWHHLRLITDRNGFSTRLQYDSNLHLIEATDSAGRRIVFTNDKSGRILKVETGSADNAEDTQTMAAYQYDEDGRLVSFSDASGSEQILSWNERNKLESRRFKGGHIFNFKYDSKDRCIAAEGPDGKFSYFFEYREELTIVTDSMGVMKRYFHRDGIVTKETDSRGGEHIYFYDDSQNLLSEETPDGKIKIMNYDDRGNMISVQNPGEGTLKISYNEMDLPVSIKQPSGSEWKYTYDESGNLIRSVNPEGRETEYVRDSGLVSEITDSVSGTTRMLYDQHLALKAMTYPDGTVETWKRNLHGKATEYRNVKNALTHYKYDTSGRLQEVFLPDGNLISYSYDEAGNLSSVKDRDRQIHAAYDLFGNIIRRQEGNTSLLFVYDREGRLRAVENEAKEYYLLERDGEGDLIAETGFDGLRRTYIRDYTGRVNEMTVDDKHTTQYEYDDGNRISKIVRHDGTEEHYGYDLSGALIKAVNADAEVKFDRDLMGRVVEETCNGMTVESKYGISGRRERLTSSLGANIEASYDLLGDLNSLSSAGWNADFKRDAMGLEIERLLTGNLRKTVERDSIGRVREQNMMRNYTNIDKKSYLWGVNDRLLSIIDNGRERHYEYDGRGYLTRTLFEDGATEWRNPDDTGNLFETKDFSDRKYSKGGQLVKTRDWEYKYDREGNLIRKRDKHGATWRYEWNAAGMLARVKRPDAREVLFRYDALGRRIEKTFGNVVTRWVWDGNTPLHEWTETYHRAWDREKEQEYWDIWKRPLITYIFEEGTFVPAAKIAGDKAYSIVTDYLGTPVEAYDTDGNSVWERELNSYDRVRTEKGTANFVPFRYQGQYEDAETGLYYNRFRYYSPDEGMYISQDPIGLGSGEPNLYAYVQEPNTLVDLFGLSCSVYTKRFFDANPRMKKFIGKLKLEIHHRVPQMYIGANKLFPESMRTSLSNLQGTPRHIHRQVVSPAWSAFRKTNPNPTRAQVIQQAMRIDKQIAEHIGRIN